ncbi:MAG TPA: toll/interleukin-1 receptor domain-containing protein, partial [Solirubrobacteraceae bacterium]|nr:toll/interleukin-1 receptor domain-containing protein [Solirubrobacteraceae bacterium]
MLVFVSYRREDSADATDRLAASLRERLGRERVFLDVDNIDIGARFATVVDEWVGRCDVLLAVIGRDWVSATGSDGGRRLDDPGDYVRLEVEAAIARDVRVVPVLIHDARIPAAEELPESLAPLVDYNAIELTRRHWDTDVQHLIDGLERIVGAEAPRRGRGRARGVGIPSTGAQTRSERRDRSGRSGAGRRGRVLLALAVAAVALAAGVLATLGSGGGKHAPQPPAQRR